MSVIHEVVEAVAEITYNYVIAAGEEFPSMYSFLFFLAY
ncbi:Hypothetical protein KNT65_gp071 [Escherichia phage EcS1]|uniref:Uncharacterized protein n=1 Tax=Escherichia phage EcS1 TaxID=2083276 RepID=A0A2Z5ZBZ5_9CAUD|nr:Hypothetical protein KNT65_gp071 [Escherichia phage EcS1]BBC78119.1 Hypothetical protein [Escherichia phage EcS1]